MTTTFQIVEAATPAAMKTAMELLSAQGYQISGSLVVTDDFAGTRTYTILMSITTE